MSVEEGKRDELGGRRKIKTNKNEIHKSVQQTRTNKKEEDKQYKKSRTVLNT